MTPEAFVKKWEKVKVKESAADREHFIDLCHILNLPTPTEEDPSGERYTFQRYVKKITGRKGFADVWRKGCFGWEYKGKGKDLDEAYLQLLLYRDDLENPPLLVVSDLETIIVRSNFTNTQPIKETYSLKDLLDENKRQRLRQIWTNPDAYNPNPLRIQTTNATTEDLLKIADALKHKGIDRDAIAHFLVRSVFTMYAEDAGLFSGKKLFTQLLEVAHQTPNLFKPMCEQLFGLMSKGGISIVGRIPHFNGPIFSSSDAPDLDKREIGFLLSAARNDWTSIEPSIFGVLFEEVIDETKRSAAGVHYTPPGDILDVVEPVVMVPLKQEWEKVRAEAEPHIQEFYLGEAQSMGQVSLLMSETPLWEESRKQAKATIEGFLERLSKVKVLDPAAGSGNFLYITLRALLDLENEVRATLLSLDSSRPVPTRITPHQFLALEVNPYAHEICNMVLWIGYLQWLRGHDEPIQKEPILDKLPGLQNRDAVYHAPHPNPLPAGEGAIPEWPEAEFIVGNPPFLGNYKMRSELGDSYAEAIRKAYEDRLPGGVDFVCYWFEKAREQIEKGKTKRVGLIATNSIRQKLNRPVLERISQTGGIFAAWPDRPWVQDGAAVRVSIVMFDDGSQQDRTLYTFEGNEDDPKTRQTIAKITPQINPDLTGGLDLTQAKRLAENAGKSFEGVKPYGPFYVALDQAREWFDIPNPTGVSNREVLRLYISGEDLMNEPSNRWIVDFNQMTQEEASKYRQPFTFTEKFVKPEREKVARKARRDNWWRFGETSQGMRKALEPLSRYIVTVKVAKHRAFIFLDNNSLPSDRLIVFAMDSDLYFGLLNSTPHIVWSLAAGGTLEDRPFYTSTTCFETFPFPHPSDSIKTQIEQAARHLDKMRSYLKERHSKTLTELYNSLSDHRKTPTPSTAWVEPLLEAHTDLDKAVHAAYGWEYPLSEEQILERLLALNLERAAQQG